MKRFREVSKNILRGGVPTPEEIQILKDAWGVSRIISLDLDAGEKIAPICERLGIEHLIIPIEFDDLIEDTLNFLSKNIVSLFKDNQPVYVHCVHGRDRTGLAVALYRVKGEGWASEEALLEAKELDFGDGLEPEYEEIFTSIVENATDTNDVDAVSIVRDNQYTGTAAGEGTGFNYFSPIPPIQEFFLGYPKSPLPPESFATDDLKRERRLRRKFFKDVNDAMAYVGVTDSTNPILRYVNPIGGNLSPEGVGPQGMLPYGNYYL